MPVYVVENGDPGAPSLNNAAGAIFSVLDHCLIIGRVLGYDGSSYTDNTSAARREGSNTFPLLPTASTAAHAYFAHPGKIYAGGDIWRSAFRQLVFNLQTPGSNIQYIWEYWNGTTWSSLTVQDGTNNFTQSGTVSWVPPTDWSRTTISGYNAWWVRVRPSVSPSTVPIVDSVTAVGWLRAFVGTNIVVYRPGPLQGKLRYYFRISHTSAGDALIVGYEGMTNINTGTYRFPTDTSMIIYTGGGTSPVEWMVAADSRTFILIVATQDASTRIVHYVGDYIHSNPNFLYNVMIGSFRQGATARFGRNFMSDTSGETVVFARNPSGAIVGSRGAICMYDYAVTESREAPGNSPSFPGPNPADGRFWTAPLHLVDRSTANFPIVGYCRGIWAPLFYGGSVPHRTILEGAGPMSGRALMHNWKCTTWSTVTHDWDSWPPQLEVTDTWDT